MAGDGRIPNASTHHHSAHPSQDYRDTGGEHTQTQARTQNTHITNLSQEWRGAGGARTQTHTLQHPSQGWRGQKNTVTETHPARISARISGVTPKPERAHTHRTPQPGLARYRQITHTTTHTPTTQPGLAGRTRARTETHTATLPTPARIGGVKPKLVPGPAQPKPKKAKARNGWVQAERARQHTHPNTPPRIGRGISKTQTCTHTPQSDARIGRVKQKPAPEYTHRTPQPGLAGYRRSANTNVHTLTRQPGLAG